MLQEKIDKFRGKSLADREKELQQILSNKSSEKAKEWISKGAQPSDRVKLFLSTMGVGEKPIITEKTKQHLQLVNFQK